MKRIYSAKTYNETEAGKNRPALTEAGQYRQTGYVLICDETNERIWFPNEQQARIEREAPGKYGPRGIKVD